MQTYVVYEQVQELVTYKHVVDANDADAARRIVLETRTPDEGSWTDTISDGREITSIEEVKHG